MTVTESKTNIAALQAQIKAHADEADRILGTFKTEGDGLFVVSTEQKAAYTAEVAKAEELGEILTKQLGVNGLRDLAGEAESATADSPMQQKSIAMAQAAGAAGAGSGLMPYEGSKSPGQQYIESKQMQNYTGHGDSEPFQVEVKDVFTTLPGTVTNIGFGTTEREPLVTRQFRTQRVRDLLGSRQTNSNLIEFYRVTGLVNNAAPVAERDTTPTPDVFARKPQSSLTFAPDQAPVRTIAHWEAIHRNTLADEASLRATIDNELLYGLRLAEDAQLLSGSGTGENVLGLLNKPGIQTYDWSDGTTGDNKADAVRRAITKVILSNYEATGVVLHPLDWEDIELAKDDNARYIVSIGVAMGAEQRLWRISVVATPVIPVGTFLTGAFGLGASIYDREAANIRMTENHEDFFVRNAIVVLAEQRLALVVRRPESFVKGSFDAAPS